MRKRVSTRDADRAGRLHCRQKQVVTSHINLIWSPVAFIDTGIEYMWGQRRAAAGDIYGTEQALIGKFRVKF